MDYPSKLIENAVNELSKLPGVGKKMALRFVLHLLKSGNRQTESLAKSLVDLVNGIKYCKHCFSLSDEDMCSICSNESRNKKVICIVEDIRDLISIENTGQFNGVYHVLGGVISPIEGIGPEQLRIQQLIERISLNQVEEIILALPTTVEGDTTSFYLYRQLQNFSIKITTLAKGIPIGDHLEYADEITLGRSLLNRIPYEKTLTKIH